MNPQPTPTVIRLSPKAAAHLQLLLADIKTAHGALSLFVDNCSMALDIDPAKFTFDTSIGAFIARPLPSVPVEAEIIVDESDRIERAGDGETPPDSADALPFEPQKNR